MTIISEFDPRAGHRQVWPLLSSAEQRLGPSDRGEPVRYTVQVQNMCHGLTSDERTRSDESRIARRDCSGADEPVKRALNTRSFEVLESL